MTVGINNNSDVMASDLELLEDESRFTIHYQDKTYQMTCPVPGIAFVYNSLVAFLIGMLMHIDISSIKKGIENFSLTKNRMEISTTKNNITIINDVYNASVDSMKSSLEILKNRNCERRIAVLGSMLELGSFSKELHETVGEEVWKNHIDVLVTIGDDALFIGKKAEMLGMPAKNIHHFTSNEDAISYLKKSLKPKDAILLKASNSLHFIEIVDALKEN